eukprot:366572-Chlamydomonas_euryale.AAC.3
MVPTCPLALLILARVPPTHLALPAKVELFARGDAEFMAMFRAPGALEAMNRRLESLNRRVDALLKMKVEFQELARAL